MIIRRVGFVCSEHLGLVEVAALVRVVLLRDISFDVIEERYIGLRKRLMLLLLQHDPHSLFNLVVMDGPIFIMVELRSQFVPMLVRIDRAADGEESDEDFHGWI